MSVRRLLITLFGMFFSIASPKALAADVEVVKGGPVHEAYITQEGGEIILEAVADKPPIEVDEKIPPQSDEKAKWIKGYWAYSKERGEFLWVSGVWRRPPPGHQWIAGEWQRFPEGWVWLPGFWSATAERNIDYIQTPPHDPIDENIPPSPGQDYFWVPGYWYYDKGDQEYVWTSGKWETFDKNWVYVPAHYLWREEGYIFIPAYWDWPVDSRGVVYAAVSFGDTDTSTIIFEPTVVLDPIYILELYYPCYPYYLCLFHHHYFFHHDFWISWGGIPPWWGWADWWCFSWVDQWALWWWWTHPGFPQPLWLDMALANDIGPPPPFVLDMMKEVLPPPIVTPNGIIGPDELLEAIEEVTQDNDPILPTDPDEIEDIQQEARPKKPRRPFLLPKGPTTPLQEGPPKPHFGPSREDLTRPPRGVRPPAIPSVPQGSVRRPPIRRVRPPSRHPSEPPIRMEPRAPRRPDYRPREPRRPREPHMPSWPRGPRRPDYYRPTPPQQEPSYPPQRPHTRPRPYPRPDNTPIRPNRPHPGPSEIPHTKPPAQSEIPRTAPPTHSGRPKPPSYQRSGPRFPAIDARRRHVAPRPRSEIPRTAPPTHSGRSKPPSYQQSGPRFPAIDARRRHYTPRTRPEYQPQRPNMQPHYQSHQQGQSFETKWPPTPMGNSNRGNFMQRPLPKQNPQGHSPHHPRGYW